MDEVLPHRKSVVITSTSVKICNTYMHSYVYKINSLYINFSFTLIK